MRLGILLIVLLLGFTALTACSPQINPEDYLKQKQQPEVTSTNVLLEDVMKGENPIAFANNNRLYVVDPDFPRPFELYAFNQGELPADTALNRFSVSPQKHWVIWYTPTKGLLGLNINTKKIEVLSPPNDFLNTYPYVEFANNQEMVMFITSNGNVLEKVDLTTLQKQDTTIPYPYGNVFKVSPNDKYILFVSGYGQTKDKPKFMFTEFSGKFIGQFSTKTNLSDRNWVLWNPSSTGIYMIEDNFLGFYPVSTPGTFQKDIVLSPGTKITSIKRMSNQIYISDSDGYWHVYDADSKKELARTPSVIASELHNPYFIPWKERQFLIEETIIDGPSQFARLWESDLKGNKKIVIEKYNEVVLTTQPQIVD